MSFELYVGNYPGHFSRKDVAEIFRDFDGIEVQKFFKREKKCYSFLLCKDINQVVSVIREKNNATVSGRKLIVRASDMKLQEYVELLLREANDQVEISQGNDAGKTRPVTESKDAYSNKFPGERNSFDSPTFVPVQVLRNKASNTRVKDSDKQYDKNSCHSPCSSGSYHPFDERCADNYESETASSKSSYYPDNYESETASSKSGYHPNSLHYEDDISELTWLSVTNFPLGSSKRSLYELFSDYNPVDVQMICNEARRDKAITEAYVCFLNRDIADDVILNFDNTVFNGRILLVNDTQDLTVMNELLNVLRL